MVTEPRCGSILLTEPSDPSETHRDPPPNARSVGPPPTRVASVLLVSGSIRETVPSRKFAT